LVNRSRAGTLQRDCDLRSDRHGQDLRLHVSVRREQLIAYGADERKKHIGGLVLEVKGDFCHKVEDILKRHGRENDYVELNVNAEYRYNPLYNDLDAYALAYNIASLLNNLFGQGKEPFWQQAYTNLVKFIIQLGRL
jgi:hypothetical protein